MGASQEAFKSLSGEEKAQVMTGLQAKVRARHLVRPAFVW